MLPNLAKGESNKMWIVPSQLSDALRGLGAMAGAAVPKAITGADEPDAGEFSAPKPVDVFAEIEAQKKVDEESSAASVEQAIAEAEALEGRRVARLQASQSENALTTGLAAPQHLAPQPQAEPAQPESVQPEPVQPAPVQPTPEA